MDLRYHDDFVEAAVLTALRGKRPAVLSSQIRRFHFERERCYGILDLDERNTAFFQVHLSWFREWGLEELLHAVIREYPLLTSGLRTLVFRQPRTRRDEAAELYVNAESGRSGVVAMQPERFAHDDAVRHFLGHEFMHLSDMLDPAFGYVPDLRARGIDPSHEGIVRERYRVLWDTTVDGRLARTLDGEHDRSLFDRAFSFWPESLRDEVFSKFWKMKSPKHEELLALACDPRDLSHADRPLPGGSCPLCGFSTFEWANADALADATRATIEREFPRWSPAQGACRRCAEVYAVADRYANALPQ